ncbi:DUF4286 family protein [Massilia putida]|uniref:DUF4286 family protein n=1 Tax=Massilia putida TaxID=1141883 RepID=UPI000952470F|nr:DUF4286 family protein [Massilia putida]
MRLDKALLLVMMEAPADMEAEFHDWYDTEHLPQRLGLPGVESGARWVCVEGWPRWMALYDLASSAALETPEYLAVSGANSTPWSKRVLPRTVGRSRACLHAVAVHDGPAGAGAPARLLLARFPQQGLERRAILIEALNAGLARHRALRQVRYFALGDILYAIASFDRVVATAALADVIEQLPAAADLVNHYAPYQRG